ncbi:glutamate receptor U1-like [Centruroides vittatus]|uniref:glutamate receptor U1-like n=1 Tax=Centruroides vittatus TaxID=120091 RepID=UPI00350EFE51
MYRRIGLIFVIAAGSFRSEIRIEEDISLSLLESISSMLTFILNLLYSVSIISSSNETSITEDKEILFSGVNCPPYSIFEPKNDFVGGYEYELIKLLSEKLQLSYKLVKPIETEYGEKFNGSWTGIVGRIERKEIHLGIPSLFLTYRKLQSIDYARYHRFAEIIFIVRAPERKSLLMAIFRPFSIDMWSSILCSVIISGIILHYLSKICSMLRPNIECWTLMETYWFLFGTLTFKGGDLRKIKHHSLQIVIGFWWLAILVIGYGYTECLFSFLTYPEFEYVPTTFAELKSDVVDGKFLCGTLKMGGVDNILMYSKRGSAKIINNEIRKKDSSFVFSYEEGMERVLKENYIFIEDSSVIKELANKLGQNKFILSKDSIFSNVAAFGISKRLSYRHRMNTMILRIFESGIVEKLLTDELAKSKSLNKYIHYRDVKPLSMEDLFSPFILLTVGYTISIILFIFEILFAKIS